MKTLKTYFKDDVKSRRLLPDGRYKRLNPSAKRPALRAQEVLYRLVCDAAVIAEQSQRTVFEPHQAPDTAH